MSLTMRVGMRQVQGVAKWEISFIQEGELCTWVRVVSGNRDQGTRLLT